jgi:hypothetical protein
MANWDAITVKAAITRIKDESLVLPVIQRRLVWDEDKMELLFDTLLRSNSFGGIMSIEEEKDSKPIFAFRHFAIDGEATKSIPPATLTKGHNLVIDGQQRLQSFYMGLCGTYNGKQLYFDLYSDYEENEFNFRFVRDPATLPETDEEKTCITSCLWYSVKGLFEQLDLSNDEDQVCDSISTKYMIVESEKVRSVQKNVRLFYKNVFSQPHVGIARVTVNRLEAPSKSRQKIVELFRRLNDGGTKLSAYDLAASIMKGFDWQMESFLDEMLLSNRSIGLTQDNLLKLIFLLRDNSRKEMMDIEAEDAAFAVDNKERISAALGACVQFLRFANLLDYYAEAKPSFIPLFFIIYHFYYSGLANGELKHSLDNYDVSNPDYPLLFRWLALSLLNGVFRSRGAGWIPYKTGIRKILEVMRVNRGKRFPCAQLINMYKGHPLYFNEIVDENTLNLFDRNVFFLLLYNLPLNVREQDVDHIQPRSLLDSVEEYREITNIVENYQLLDSGTNRGVKRAKVLADWIEQNVDNKEVYLAKHHIPSDPVLWTLGRYPDFIVERRKLLVTALNRRLLTQ